jgi:predicted nucleic-acid-binding Zn-ribbon protein
MKLLDIIFESVIELNEKMTQDEFIDKSNKVHGDRYDYKDAVYINNKTNVTIICKNHGPFQVTPSNFLAGGNCPKCGKESARQKQVSSTDEFIKKSIEKHGDKYNYTKVNYKTAKIPITVTCLKHGDFQITPNKHLLGAGCKKCYFDKKRHSIDDFIRKAKQKHGDTYDYSNVKYVNDITPVEIICTKHGPFYASPNNHIGKSSGCASCKHSKGEKILNQLLEDKGLKFETESKFSECIGYSDEHTCIKSRKLKFDFYVPELNTLIEYDGAFHFIQMGMVNDDQFLRDILNDKQKNDFTKRKSIKLIRIAYTDFDSISEELENGLNSNKQLYLSKNYPTDKGWVGFDIKTIQK